MARRQPKTNQPANQNGDTMPKVEKLVTECACENLIEIGFHRSKDDVVYITFLCQDCQRIKIKKFELKLLGEMKFYG